MGLHWRGVILLVFFVSGFCGLAYEIVWTRLLTLVLGGTMLAVTTVVACFMAGLAGGSHLAGRYGGRLRDPLAAYGVMEIAIGLFCLATPLLLDAAMPLYRWLALAAGDSALSLQAARVLVCCLVLLVPTLLMGATLPVLSKAYVSSDTGLGLGVARLYGLNTLGGFAGCVAAGLFLLPAVGLRTTVAMAAVLNVVAGVVAFLLRHAARGSVASDLPTGDDGGVSGGSLCRKPACGRSPAGSPGVSVASDLPTGEGSRFLLWLYAVCGFTSMAYQILWTRTLILALGASVYAFSLILSAFILGLALGGMGVSLFIGRIRNPLRAAGVLQAIVALSALFIVPLLGDMPGRVRGLCGPASVSFARLLSMEGLMVVGLLIVPTVCMGAILPMVCAAAGDAPRPEPANDGQAVSPVARTVGSVYAANTVGAIAGTCITGFFLIPCSGLGIQRTIVLMSGLGGIVATLFLLQSGVRRRSLAMAGVVAAWCVGLAVAALTAPWSRLQMVSGPYLGRGLDPSERVLLYREGSDATVAVSTLQGGHLVLRINGKPDASTRSEDMPTQVLAGNLPLLLRPGTRDVCVIGLGSGISLGAALAHPVERVDVAELSGGVIEAAKAFAAHNHGAVSDPRVRLLHSDGRNHLLTTRRRYDVIISEPSNVWISGMGELFTKEFFQIARATLKPGGLHCQWVHSYSISSQDFAAVLKTAASVFPHIQVWSMSFGDYLVVGSEASIAIDPAALAEAFRREPVADAMRGIRIQTPQQLAYHFAAEGSGLTSWLADRRFLTDDVPHLEYSAPRYLSRNEGMEIGRMLDELGGVPAMAGGSESAANAEFLRKITLARESRRHLRESVLAARRQDAVGLLDQFLAAATAAPEDERVLSVIRPQLARLRASSAAAATLVDRYRVRMAVVAPAIAAPP